LVPVTHTQGRGYDLIGEAWWPPKAAVWAQRRPIAGAVIKPGQTLNLCSA
jgi:hypothetical protein